MTQDFFSGPTEHLREELASIRSGRANPGLLEKIEVSAYESKMRLQELGSISMPEPQSLVIQPWDISMLKNIEKAIQESSLGLQPINDGQVIRLVFPPLTEERRKEYIVLVHEKAEEARVAVRSIREKEMRKIKQQEQDGAISEDDSKKQQKEFQDLVDKAIGTIKDMAEGKEHDIATL